MLRTYAAPPWVVGSVFPKLGFVQKGELPGHLEGVCSLEVVLPGGMNMASCLISMVSKIYHPKIPGADIPSEWKPCWSQCARQGKTMLRTCAAVRHAVGPATAYVLSLVFYWRQFKLPGASTPPEWKPCLSNLLPLRRLVQHTC